MLPEPALLALWRAVLGRKAPPFSLDLGIAAKWASDPYRYGSVLTPEIPDGENTIQVFTIRAIRWTPSGPEDVG